MILNSVSGIAGEDQKQPLNPGGRYRAELVVSEDIEFCTADMLISLDKAHDSVGAEWNNSPVVKHPV